MATGYSMFITLTVSNQNNHNFKTLTYLITVEILVNKRLDDWVEEDYLDTRKIQFPRKDGTQGGTGLSTPKKVGGTTGSSRPSSPLGTAGHSDVTVNGSALLAAALQKRNGRKRKAGDKEDVAPPLKKLISKYFFNTIILLIKL